MFRSRKTVIQISLVALLLAIVVSLSGCYSGAMSLINLLTPSIETETGNSASNSANGADIDASVPREDMIKSIVKAASEPSLYGSAGTDVFAVSEVVRMVQDSVVQIYTESGAGSGVIIDPEYGWVITCNHVINDASAYIVELSDGSRYNATLRGGDPDADIAILKITPSETLTVATLGASEDLVAGEQIVVIGNPLGTLGGTVTVGYISATERQISFSNSDGTETTMTLIQTDAAINAGNSGGAMFNLKGELIGIVNAKYSETGVEGLGFAIPIDKAYDVACELIQYGYIRNVPDDGLSLLNQTDYGVRGLLVTGSKYNSELLYKYIVSVNGIEVSSVAEYKAVIAGSQVNDEIVIQYVNARRPYYISSSNRHTTTITLREKVPSR